MLPAFTVPPAVLAQLLAPCLLLPVLFLEPLHLRQVLRGVTTTHKSQKTMNDGLETESTEEMNGPGLSQMPLCPIE